MVVVTDPDEQSFLLNREAAVGNVVAGEHYGERVTDAWWGTEVEISQPARFIFTPYV